MIGVAGGAADPRRQAFGAGALARALAEPSGLLRIALAGVVLVAGGLALLLAWQRAYQVDEVESIHAAYALASGKLIYRDFWQGHHPLLYLLLAPILPVDEPVVAFRVARLLCFALFVASVGLAGWLTRRLGGVAALAMALLLLHSTFVERGLEVRPDTLMTPLVLLALLVGTFESRPTRWRFLVQALLLGFAFVATQKAAIASFAFGCFWLACAMRDRRPSLVVLPCAVWLIPWLALLGGLAIQGGLEDYARFNLFHPSESVQGQGAAAAVRFSALDPLRVEGARNLAFCVAAIAAGIAVLVGLIRRGSTDRQRALWPTAALAAVWIAGLFVMPFPYPYSQAAGIPPIAVVIATVVGQEIGRHRPTLRRARVVALVSGVLVLAAMATSLPRIVGERAKDNARQLRVLERVDALSDASSPVLDLAGLYFRPDAYPVYVMTGAHYARYRRGDYPPIAPWLREHGLDLFVVNYRMRWLDGEDRAFLQENFVRVEPNLFLSGRDLDGMAADETRRFEVTRAGDYRFDGEGELLVDGRAFRSGRLERGVYALSAPGGIGRGRLVSARAPERPSAPIADVPLFYGFD
ncbi:MAG: hypothetical protein R3F35_21015 [Myxococcota bacterium]